MCICGNSGIGVRFDAKCQHQKRASLSCLQLSEPLQVTAARAYCSTCPRNPSLYELQQPIFRFPFEEIVRKSRLILGQVFARW